MKLALKILIALIFVFLILSAWLFFLKSKASKIKDCIVTNQYKVSLCPKGKNYVKLNSISPYFKNLVLIAEDAAFYSHDGFDWLELKNSIMSNLRARKFARGGSTITQQLAKNVFLDFEKSIFRKIKEAILTAEIEKILSKDEIFEKYLNVIEFGPNIFGVKNAARFYFQKSASELNLLESAFLVYLIPNPKDHSRTFNKKQLTPYARFRILDLTFRLYKYKRINLSEYFAARDVVDQFPWDKVTFESPNTVEALITESLSEEQMNSQNDSATPPILDQEETQSDQENTTDPESIFDE